MTLHPLTTPTLQTTGPTHRCYCEADPWAFAAMEKLSQWLDGPASEFR